MKSLRGPREGGRLPPVVALAAALGWLAFAAPAAAQTKVAVLGVEAKTGAPAELAQRCSTALLTHLKGAGYVRVQGKSMVEVKLVFGCVDESAECLAKVGKSLSADKLLWGELNKKKRAYVLNLWLLDVHSQKLTPLTRQLSLRVLKRDPEGVVRKLVASLLPVQMGTIKLASSVSGAEVLLDGRPMGSINDQGLDMQVRVGSHTVQVRRDGYRAWVKRVVISHGQSLPLRAELEIIERGSGVPPIVSPPLVTKKVRSKRTGWKVAFYLSVAATAGLGAGLGINGKKVVDLQDEKNALIADAKTPGAARQGGCSTPGLAGMSDPNAKNLNDVCSSGDTRAKVQNVMIGGIAATALLAAFFLYKAYLQLDPAEDVDVAAEAPRPHLASQGRRGPLARQDTALQWQLTPTFGPQGGGLGVTVNF